MLWDALVAVLPRADPRTLREHTESMAAIADDYGVSVLDVARNWILFTPQKEVESLSKFVKWCAAIKDLEDRTQTCVKMCPRCYSQPAQRITDQLFFCSTCGGVVA